MKHLFTIVLLAFIVTEANATKRIITCQNSPTHFLPLTQTAVVGDTIHWTWVAGNHIVGPINPTDIPAGAATFNAPIDANHHDFEYVVIQPGTYYYVCHPGTPHGEDGYLTVTGTTGVDQLNLNNAFSAYPNPSDGNFQLTVDGAQLTENSRAEIYNLLGNLVYQTRITALRTDIDLDEQAAGSYFIRYYNGQQAVLTKKIVIR